MYAADTRAPHESRLLPRSFLVLIVAQTDEFLGSGVCTSMYAMYTT